MTPPSQPLSKWVVATIVVGRFGRAWEPRLARCFACGTRIMGTVRRLNPLWRYGLLDAHHRERLREWLMATVNAHRNVRLSAPRGGTGTNPGGTSHLMKPEARPPRPAEAALERRGEGFRALARITQPLRSSVRSSRFLMSLQVRSAIPSILLFFYLALDSSVVWATTWSVTIDQRGDARSVSEAMSLCSPGDTVLVGPGRYLESVDFAGKDVVLRSVQGPECTILDGGFDELVGVVRFRGGETQAAIIEGFTITGDKFGIGILSAQPTIQGNIITRNTGAEEGAGILCTSAFPAGPAWIPVIRENQILENDASLLGGGICIWGQFAPEISQNLIAGNRAQRGDGGGLFILTNAPGTIIEGNAILNNTAGDHGGGIYVWSTGAVAVDLGIEWNTIIGNAALGIGATGSSGGGLWSGASNVRVRNNSFLDNSGRGLGESWGGDIAIDGTGIVLIERNIFAYTVCGGAIRCESSESTTITNNLVWLTTGGYGAGCGDWWLHGGNIAEDPLFCRSFPGDASVAQTSPALTHSSGPLGAIPTAGCEGTAVREVTWGRIKARY